MIVKTNFNKGQIVWTTLQVQAYFFLIPVKCLVQEIKVETSSKSDKLDIRYYLKPIFPRSDNGEGFYRKESLIFAESEECQLYCDNENEKSN